MAKCNFEIINALCINVLQLNKLILSRQLLTIYIRNTYFLIDISHKSSDTRYPKVIEIKVIWWTVVTLYLVELDKMEHYLISTKNETASSILFLK
jgi:hypothetical protein